jgi:hypothetical protein
MAASSARTYDVTPATLKSLFESQVSHRLEGKIDQVTALLKKKFGVEPTVFNYMPQMVEDNRESGAWGKAAVSVPPTTRAVEVGETESEYRITGVLNTVPPG